jgi:hypothetical protein
MFSKYKIYKPQTHLGLGAWLTYMASTAKPQCQQQQSVSIQTIYKDISFKQWNKYPVLCVILDKRIATLEHVQKSSISALEV